MARKELTPAVAYLRTSSTANTGADKDSGRRQRAAIDAFARSAGFAILDSYYDEAVSGADPVTSRSGFAAMMERIASDGVRVIIVETANRFARDLIVQETGFAMLKEQGVELHRRQGRRPEELCRARREPRAAREAPPPLSDQWPAPLIAGCLKSPRWVG